MGFSNKNQKEPKYIHMRPRPLREFDMNHSDSLHCNYQ
jgi:hypothetical protein